MAENNFKQKVYELVASIPSGRIMTYGQIAALCGSPRASRIVGQIARFGDPDLPWQRVVKKGGFMAGGFPGGMQNQQAMLESEGVEFKEDFQIRDVDVVTYHP